MNIEFFFIVPVGRRRGSTCSPHPNISDQLASRVLPQGPTAGRQSQVGTKDNRRSEETVPRGTTAAEPDKRHEDRRRGVQGVC